ncbi:hypothetical protein [uncultured Croceitalea sp.]|uniref:hypothetical protein n=1 Tax=uncultured Croceitalea sp. TaxID=1798908 RepID=UPI00374E4102
MLDKNLLQPWPLKPLEISIWTDGTSHKYIKSKLLESLNEDSYLEALKEIAHEKDGAEKDILLRKIEKTEKENAVHLQGILEEKESSIDCKKGQETSLPKSILTGLFNIIPAASRAEAIADLQDIMTDLKENNFIRIRIWTILLIHVFSVVCHSFFLKLRGYFNLVYQQSSRE